MFKRKLLSSWLLFFSVLLLYSCHKEFKTPEWQTDLLTPVLTAKLSWSDLLADTSLVKNNDNALNFVYRKNILDFTTDTLLNIKDVKIDTFYRFPGNYINLNAGTVLFNYEQEEKISIKDVELREIKLKSGFLVIKVKSYVTADMDARFQMPKATFNTKAFDTTLVVPKRVSTDQGGEVVSRIDLKGYTIDLTGIKGKLANIMVFGISAAPKEDVRIYSRDTLLVTCSFEKVVPEYGVGYLGQSSFNIDSKIPDFSFVKNVNGKIVLDSVKLVLNVENGIGVDARVKITQFNAINSVTGKEVPLSGSIINKALNISRALRKHPVFIPSSQSFTINSANSNINEFISNLPDKLTCKITAQFNPLGDISGGNDFVYDNSKLKIGAYLQMPLRFAAQDLTLTKDIDYSIASSDPNLKKGNLYLYANNGFPFNASLQLYLLDDKGSIIDSLVGNSNTIQSAVVDAITLRVTQKKQTQLTIPVNEARLKLLYDRKKIKAKLKLNTPAYPSTIIMYDNYDMDLKLVGDFIYNVNLK